ncbi:MAG: pyrroloquinoline quinone-dependent dehydrogenase [Bryobacterales bacterium]
MGLFATAHHSVDRRRISALPALVFLAVLAAPAQQWTHYGGDSSGQKYSALDQINRSNVSKLEVAWQFDTGDYSDGTQGYPSKSAFEGTPLVVDGVMYLTTPFSRLIALEPETGKQLWAFDSGLDKRNRVNLFANRGGALWRDGDQKRFFLANQDGALFSVDLATGEADPNFGDNGRLDLTDGMMQAPGRLGLTSPVAVCGDVVVAGSWVTDALPQGPAGDIRGFDARTGKLRWTFHTVPRPGEFGHETWEGDSWVKRGGTNSWSISSVDAENGLVFVPLTSPSTDFYGGDRKGQNLFGNSLVALDCASGERRWHYQTIHHDLWDWDLPAQPVLIEVERGSETVPAVAQVTKMGFVYVFNRLTGEPLFPIDERPVPRSEVPGDESWPTQPHPQKPPPVARQSITRADITSVTPESRAECLEMIEGAAVEGLLFRPIREEQLTVMFPGTNGGPNWGGGSWDPETSTLYVNSMDVGAFVRMVESENPDYRSRGTKYGRFWDSNQYPCQKPPWAHLTAVDLNSGEFRWRSVLGEFDELTAKGLPKTGAPNLGGSIVTKGGLVFIAATNDSRFRAFDKDSGEQLWEVRLPASSHATPMTYLGKDGRQYVAIAAGGGTNTTTPIWLHS